MSDDMKSYWQDKIEKGLDICRRDHEEMKLK